MKEFLELYWDEIKEILETIYFTIKEYIIKAVDGE